MAMFTNLLDALEQHGNAADASMHVQLMEGRLAYGGWAVAPSLFPSREDRPDRSPSWYFDQEDELVARMKRRVYWQAGLFCTAIVASSALVYPGCDRLHVQASAMAGNNLAAASNAGARKRWAS